MESGTIQGLADKHLQGWAWWGYAGLECYDTKGVPIPQYVAMMSRTYAQVNGSCCAPGYGDWEWRMRLHPCAHCVFWPQLMPTLSSPALRSYAFWLVVMFVRSCPCTLSLYECPSLPVPRAHTIWIPRGCW